MIIACDVDECLVQFLKSACGFYNEVYRKNGDKRIRVSDFRKFDFKDVLGIEQGEVEAFLRAHIKSEYFDRMELVDGAREGLLRLMERHNVPLVTSRSNGSKFKTRSYFERGFPYHSFDIYFEGWSKLDKLRELRADAIVEDSVDSLEYAEDGIKVVLYDRVWNRELEHENIYRCEDWGKIVDTVEGFENV